MRSARKASPMSRMMGIPPHTLASTPRFTLWLAARANKAGPCCARRFLLADTTDLPCSKALVTTRRGASTPPMSSTTMLISGSSVSSSSLVVNFTPAGTPKRLRVASRTKTVLILSCEAAGDRPMSSIKPLPMVPAPASPMMVMGLPQRAKDTFFCSTRQ